MTAPENQRCQGIQIEGVNALEFFKPFGVQRVAAARADEDELARFIGPFAQPFAQLLAKAFPAPLVAERAPMIENAARRPKKTHSNPCCFIHLGSTNLVM